VAEADIAAVQAAVMPWSVVAAAAMVVAMAADMAALAEVMAMAAMVIAAATDRVDGAGVVAGA
jgi:hypothetical protein